MALFFGYVMTFIHANISFLVAQQHRSRTQSVLWGTDIMRLASGFRADSVKTTLAS